MTTVITERVTIKKLALFECLYLLMALARFDYQHYLSVFERFCSILVALSKYIAPIATIINRQQDAISTPFARGNEGSRQRATVVSSQ
ncbi:hypothetical protein [Fischerella sp. PCC 9605]|uniref:hypothetical protein n=1 Tax=Fischerella sp. PCC 9605 TaxID=1173024 RepID=UPI0018CC68F8|nr:hypothetical protein [Fischerella sp. PCC 9605]